MDLLERVNGGPVFINDREAFSAQDRASLSAVDGKAKHFVRKCLITKRRIVVALRCQPRDGDCDGIAIQVVRLDNSAVGSEHRTRITLAQPHVEREIFDRAELIASLFVVRLTVGRVRLWV